MHVHTAMGGIDGFDAGNSALFVHAGPHAVFDIDEAVDRQQVENVIVVAVIVVAAVAALVVIVIVIGRSHGS